MASLRGQIQPLRRAFLDPRGHHLDSGQPYVAPQRLLARRLAHRRQIEKARQLASQTLARKARRIAEEGGECAMLHHLAVVHALAETVDKIAVDVHARRRVGEVGVPIVVDVRAADVTANLTHQRLAEGVRRGPATRPVQQIEAFEQRCAGAVPIARTLVAAAIVRVSVEEVVETAQRLVYGRLAPLLVKLLEQRGGEPVGADPRSPVV